MYLFYYLFIVFLGFIADFSRNRIISNASLYLVFIICTLIGGFRSWNVGQDTKNYIFIIDNIEYYNISNLEPFFLYLNKILNSLFSGDLRYTILFLLISGLTWFFFLLGAKQKSISVGILLTILFGHMNAFFDQFNAIRQLLALSIVFYGTTFLLNNKYKKFIFFVLIGSLFHYTSLLSLVFIPIYKFKKYWKTIILISFIFLLFFIEYIFGYLISFSSKYNDYEDIGLTGNYIGNGIFVFNILILVLLLLFKNYVSKSFKDDYFYFLILVCISFIFQLITFYNSIGGDVIVRASYYFSLGYIFLINYIFMSMKAGHKIIFWFFIILLIFVKFFFILNGSTLEVYSILDYR